MHFFVNWTGGGSISAFRFTLDLLEVFRRISSSVIEISANRVIVNQASRLSSSGWLRLCLPVTDVVYRGARPPHQKFLRVPESFITFYTRK